MKMEKEKFFVEIDSLEWHEYAAKAVKEFSRRVTAQKFYLLTPWGPYFRVVDFSETMDGFGKIGPRQTIVAANKKFFLFDLLAQDELKDLEVFSPQGGEK